MLRSTRASCWDMSTQLMRKGAEAAAAEQFKLDAFQSRRLLVQELAQ